MKKLFIALLPFFFASSAFSASDPQVDMQTSTPQTYEVKPLEVLDHHREEVKEGHEKKMKKKHNKSRKKRSSTGKVDGSQDKPDAYSTSDPTVK